MTIQAVLFDAYGTLFDVFALEAQLQSNFGEVDAPVINQIWRQKQLEYTWLRSLMDRYIPFSEITQSALSYAIEATTGSQAENEVLQTLMQAYQTLPVFPDVPEVLNRLKRDYRLGILTNANPELVRPAVAFNALELDHVLSADSSQIFKPEPSVYVLGPQALKLSKGEIAFVSANAWDVAGAATYGLNTFWLQRQKRPPEKLGQPQAQILHQLSDLVAQLKR